MEVKEVLKVTEFLDTSCKYGAWGRSYCLHLLIVSQIRIQQLLWSPMSCSFLVDSFLSLLFYHPHIFASTHLGGNQSWLMSGFFRHCGRLPDSHLKTHSIFECAAAIAFTLHFNLMNTLHIDYSIFISFSHSNFLKMCWEANQYFMIFFT